MPTRLPACVSAAPAAPTPVVVTAGRWCCRGPAGHSGSCRGGQGSRRCLCASMRWRSCGMRAGHRRAVSAGCRSVHLLCCSKQPTRTQCCEVTRSAAMLLMLLLQWLLLLPLVVSPAAASGQCLACAPAESVQLARVCTHQRVRVSAGNLRHSRKRDTRQPVSGCSTRRSATATASIAVTAR
jgi:hypothetical protein